MRWKIPRISERPPVPRQGIPRCVYLFEAIDFLGREHFGDEWTGREMLARALEKIGDHVDIPHGLRLPFGDEAGTTLPPPPWYVDHPDGRPLSFATLDAALSAHSEFSSEAKTRAVAEREARKRFETIRDMLLALLSDGSLTAFVYFPYSGNHAPLLIEFWRRQHAPHFFDMEDSLYRWENPNQFVDVPPPPANAVHDDRSIADEAACQN